MPAATAEYRLAWAEPAIRTTEVEQFYTGLIYRAIGFDPSMFTTLFALGRIPGWIAQYREMLADPNTKIGRPRQVYTGYTERDYTPIDRR